MLSFASLGRWLGAGFTNSPENLSSLSPGAQALVDKAFEDIDPSGLGAWDFHTHLGGIGTGHTGCCLNESMTNSWNPYRILKFHIFMEASGMLDMEQADKQYIERLVSLIRNIRPKPWGKHFLLAMDHWHEPDGTCAPEKTGLYVPNDYVAKIVEQYPDCFECCMSVHPYRKDALDELEKWAKKGVKLIKWLPNSMGIDPADEKCIPFYKKMRELNLALLSHTGQEHTVDMECLNQEVGNPLRLRGPLDQGVRVIAAHCASEGYSFDLDDPARPLSLNFDLFMRLMDDPKYSELLFADISSITLFRRIGKPLTTMIDRKDLHHRLVNGSDYVVPAIRMTVSTKLLVYYGYLTEEERGLINEIFEYNPLLFDYVLKRTLRSPVTGSQFSTEVFLRNPKLVPQL